MSRNTTSTKTRAVPVNTPLIGSIVAYGCVVDANSPPPTGWLLCDGKPVQRSTYKALFEVIGTMHGGGDGVNTFNLPDYRGRFQRGVDDGTGNDPDAAGRAAANVGGETGDNVGSIQAAGTGVPVGSGKSFVTNKAGKHTHTVNHLPTDNSWYYIAGSHYCKWNSDAPETSEDGEHEHKIDAGGDPQTCPINVYVNYLIYYGETVVGTEPRSNWKGKRK